jgi:hypothetical protein
MKTHTTNYIDTFITVAPDCTAKAGLEPPEGASISIAHRSFRLIKNNPYVHTSDDVIFAVHAERKQIAARDRKAARALFFSKGQACLRASDLCKRYGWGVHFDAQGRVALYGVESKEYAALSKGRSPKGEVAVKSAMRSSRAS